MTFPLQFVENLAQKIAAELAPFCDQIEIAGSIRRRRPFVGDIDLVVLPKAGQIDALIERCKQRSKIITDGRHNLIVELPLAGPPGSIQIDLFIAQPETREMFEVKHTNFGSLLLCRTGSKEHNIFLVQHAKSQGLVWNPYFGVFGPGPNGRSRLIASAAEAEIFAALKLDFLPPESRER